MNAPAPSSALPDSASAFIDRVVRATRLRRAERAEVRAELVSHFAEAIAGGQSPEQVMAQYGDAAASAKALRSAAIAKRTPIDRALVRSVQMLGVTAASLALAYVALGVYLAWNVPKPSFDPLQRIAAMLPRPKGAEEVAWPHLVTALDGLDLGDVRDDARAAAHAMTAGPGWPEQPIPEGGTPWMEQMAWCDAHADAIDALRAAAVRPVLGFPWLSGLSAEDGVLFRQETIDSSRAIVANTDQPFRAFGMLLPHLGMVRHAARVLVIDATVAAHRRDGARAVDDLEAALRLSELAQQPRFLICDLVAIAMRQLVLEHAVMLLESMPTVFSDAQLARLQAAVHAVPLELQSFHLDAERVGFEDAVQWMYTDDGSGDGWFNPIAGGMESLQSTMATNTRTSSTIDTVLRSAAHPAAALWIAGRKETMAEYDAWLAAMVERTDWSLGRLADAPRPAIEEEYATGARPMERRQLLVALLMPALGQAETVFAAARATQLAAETAIACERYRRARGVWPAQAEDLVPTWMDNVPEDPWTGKPVRMGGDGAHFRVWSVGKDRTDEAGALPVADQPDWQTELDHATARAAPHPHGTGSTQPSVLPPLDWVWFAPADTQRRWRQAPVPTDS